MAVVASAVAMAPTAILAASRAIFISGPFVEASDP
jgi:hypothetical protein